MEIKIYMADNGFSFCVGPDYNGSFVQKVFQFKEKGQQEKPELDSVKELLDEIIEILGYAGSRYDARRIKVTFEPGDKYEAPTKSL